MKLYGRINLYCDRCGKAIEIYYNNDIETKTSLRKKAIGLARRNQWKITREERCYCKECAKEIKLRGTKRGV